VEPNKGAVFPPYDEVPHGQADVQQRTTLVLQHRVPLVVVGLWPRREIAPNEAATAATHALADDVLRLFIQLRDHLLPRPTHHVGAVEAPLFPVLLLLLVCISSSPRGEAMFPFPLFVALAVPSTGVAAATVSLAIMVCSPRNDAPPPSSSVLALALPAHEAT
jgi:hypothetical protein